MNRFSVHEVEKIGMTEKQFEIIEYVLSESEEFKVYGGEDKLALDELKKYFSYTNYKLFCSHLKKEVEK